MKKTAIIYGLISGIILVANFILTVPTEGEIDFDKSGTIGMTVMVFSLALIFIAIRTYRKTSGSGSFTFGQGFRIGILTTLIASMIYVGGWMLYYESAGDNFTDQYQLYCIEKISENNKISDNDKEIQIEEFKKGIDSYKSSTVTRIFYTFREVFPLGFLITIISALLLKKKGATY